MKGKSTKYPTERTFFLKIFLYCPLIHMLKRLHSEAQNEGFSIYFRIYIVFNPSTTSTFCFIFWLENPIYT